MNRLALMRYLKSPATAACIILLSIAAFNFQVDAQLPEDSTDRTRPICSAELLAPKCVDHSSSPLDLRKSRSEADGVKFNYFRWGKEENYEELLKYGKDSSDSDQTRALSLVGIAKKYAIEYVTGGRDPSRWSIETRTIVDRIKLLQFRISEHYNSDCFDATDPGLPVAAYSPMEHTIGICHSLAKTPSNLILASILHEIGHAVSTCNMKKPLLRHKELTIEAFSCLNAAGASINESDEEAADNSLAKAISEIKFGVDVSAVNTETMIRCGSAERIPNSSLESVRAHSKFDQCAISRFAKDYERYVARFALGQDSMPNGLIPRERAIVDDFKAKEPPSCYRKSEEHFADIFSAQALALWHKGENKSLGDYRIATYDLSETYCVGRLASQNISNPFLYPSDETRLLSYLAPPYFQNQIGCKDLNKPVCTLPDDPAALTSPSSRRSLKRGTAK